MLKAETTVIILLALLTFSLVGLATISKPAMSAPDIIHVSPGESIQAAINTANSGDTIMVAAGIYRENVVINQTITLIGSGYNITFIEPPNKAKPAIDVKVNNANIAKFTIQSGSRGIQIVGYDFINISDNRIISNLNEGIYIESSLNTTVAKNIISLNSFEGVYLQFSDKTTVSDNIIAGNEAGVGLVTSNYNRISNNTIAYHSKPGASGIYLDYYSLPYTTTGNIIDGNTIQNNTHGISVPYSNSSLFYRNNFINNKNQVDSFLSANSWNTTGRGNYWSDFTQRYPNATQVDATGVWNTHYLIDPEALQYDYSPLVNPSSLPVDTTPPITTNDYDGLWQTTNFRINLTAVDDLSGVKETCYKINDGLISNVTANGQPYITAESSNNTLEYWSVDNADNTEPHHSLVNIKLDKTPPSGFIQINSGSTYATSISVGVNLSATDLTSGVAKMRFSNNATSWTLWQAYSTSKAWNLTSGDGLKTVYVQYQDVAGLASQYSGTIILDEAPPTISILSPTEDSEIKSTVVEIKWSGTDVGSGIDHFEIQLDGGTPIDVGDEETHTFTGMSDGSHTVTIEAFDKVGHSNEASVTFAVGAVQAGGLSYLETAAIIAVVVVVVAVVFYFFVVRKKGRS